ncbi:tRNA-dependent cyclodipeptide synthase [Moorena sp. SIO4E2]|uniref:tRNA-dependent cyclodipeptide synthase n=1 Tax=Moorena sp. SIO4E2 TaxID=2607826 RepID=UPI0025808805|nr:tRNA-dependent cyclodipeptide synthase [Moorena sp. SIO4E2]
MSSHRDEETIMENFDWNQLSLEQLKLLQSKISKAIDLKRRDLKLTQSTANITQVYEYKVSLAKVSPARLRSSLSDYQKCVFMISLGSKNFVYSERIEALIKWISEQFKACLVLVGDSLYRLTIEVRQGLKGDEAWLEAIRTGETFINQNRFLFQQYCGSCQFQFQMASQIEKQSEFEMYYKDFQGLYQQDESFQKMVNSFAQTYLNRGEQSEEEEVEQLLQRQKHLAITYLLEESAVFTCLAKEGWPVFVYPGSIKTFEEIAEGLHPEVPLPLKQMIWVSLRLKRKATAGESI